MGVNSYVVSPMWKNRLSRFANCACVSLSRPVFPSATAPVRFWYVASASDAMSRSVVPVSVMPAVDASTVVPAAPYVIDWSMPT